MIFLLPLICAYLCVSVHQSHGNYLQQPRNLYFFSNVWTSSCFVKKLIYLQIVAQPSYDF